MAKRRKSTPGPYLLHAKVLWDRVPDATLYPFALPAVRGLARLEFHPKVTFLVGENGAGKSTLLEAVAVASGLNPEGGSRNFNFATRKSHSALADYLRLARPPATAADSYFLRAESFYNVATNIEKLDRARGPGPPVISAYGGTSLHEQSHGESFFALFRHRFGAHGLYLMDEPEAALSPARQLQFLALLHQYLALGCQFVIATHSPIVLAYPDATIYQLDSEGLRAVAYTATEHYQITRAFMSNPDRALRELLAE